MYKYPQLEIAEDPRVLPHFVKTYEGLLYDILVPLVAAPYDLDVSEVENPEEPETLFLEVRVAAEDRGKVIGKQGATIGALHKIFVAISRGRPVKINVQERSGNG